MPSDPTTLLDDIADLRHLAEKWVEHDADYMTAINALDRLEADVRERKES
jgi:hypothetical protein